MFTLTFLLSAALLTIAQPPSLNQWLTQNKWKHRIILVYAPSASNPDLKRQRDALAADPAGLSERDLLVRELSADQLSDADRTFLQQELNTSGNTFQVLLIGKDGEVKLRKTSPITPKQLFGTIDGMYMRQQEMKKQSRNE